MTARATGVNTVELTVAPNASNDPVLVVATSSVDRGSDGQQPWVGTPEGQYNVGDDLLGGGTVVYSGKAETATISVLTASTAYYFVAFSYDKAAGVYSTETAQAEAHTYINVPYKADFRTLRTGCLPPDWTQSTAGTFSVTADNVISGTVAAGQGATARSFSMTPVAVDAWYGARVEVSYSLASGGEAFNNWADGSYLRLQASTDGGNTFEDVQTYTSATRPQQADIDDYKTIGGDLSRFAGNDVTLRLEWLCGDVASDVTLTVGGINMWAGEAPEVPVVRVAQTGENFGLIEWRTAYSTVEIDYRAKGDDSWVMIELSNASQAMLSDLTPGTTYEVYVRGVDTSGTYWKYTDKSETVEFTTGAWPAVDAPTGQSVDLSDFAKDGSVTFMWAKTDEMTSFDVRYRKTGDTDYTTVNGLIEPRCIVRDLAANTGYEWSVRANCTHERVTDWTEDATFTTPATGGIAALERALTVSAANGCVVVANTADVVVERVTVTDMAGRVVADKAVGTTGNVTVPVGHIGAVVVTVVTSEGRTQTKTVL